MKGYILLKDNVTLHAGDIITFDMGKHTRIGMYKLSTSIHEKMTVGQFIRYCGEKVQIWRGTKQ